MEAGSLQHTHGAARRVDRPRHGVLAVVHNVCLHHPLQIRGESIGKKSPQFHKGIKKLHCVD